MGKGGFSGFAEIGKVDKIYLFGGVLGLIITVSVMLGIANLSPTLSISVILIAQLTAAAIIDAFGLFGSEKMAFGWTKYLGVALMVAGVIIFKLECKQN